MKLKALVAGVVGAFAITTAANAADPIIIPPPAPPPPMVVAPAGYDWGGFYAGASVVAAVLIIGPGAGAPPAIAAVGVQAGFNLVRGNLLIGAEVGIIRVFGGASTAALVGGRAGLILGARDRAVVFAEAFYGITITGAGTNGLLLGAGVEFGVSDRLSVFTDALGTFGGAGTGCCLVRLGANFHFGN